MSIDMSIYFCYNTHTLKIGAKKYPLAAGRLEIIGLGYLLGMVHLVINPPQGSNLALSMLLTAYNGSGDLA
jgi:hypothetical protein